MGRTGLLEKVPIHNEQNSSKEMLQRIDPSLLATCLLCFDESYLAPLTHWLYILLEYSGSILIRKNFENASWQVFRLAGKHFHLRIINIKGRKQGWALGQKLCISLFCSVIRGLHELLSNCMWFVRWIWTEGNNQCGVEMANLMEGIGRMNILMCVPYWFTIQIIPAVWQLPISTVQMLHIRIYAFSYLVFGKCTNAPEWPRHISRHQTDPPQFSGYYILILSTALIFRSDGS